MLFADKFELISVADSTADDILRKCLSFPKIKTQKPISQQTHFDYFKSYLFENSHGGGAQTIIIEKEYTSLSYLGDYVNYYANCYKPYSRNCRRIHFFQELFNQDKFIEILLRGQESDSKIWNSYLGYIVVKPLPKGIIGATLLRPKTTGTTDKFTAVRSYPVNLFGKHLEIETLPFQEQDGIVGSCASSALWCAFHQTSSLFGSARQNPSDITIMAGSDLYSTGKSFPSLGLEISQVCKAIQENDLVSEVRNSEYMKKNALYAKAFIYAYLRMGIPVLLGTENKNKEGHLVALNGYQAAAIPNVPNNEIKFLSNLVGCLFAHDDQIGPFSKVKIEASNNEVWAISRYETTGGYQKDLKSEVKTIIVPIKKNIAVTFEDICSQAIAIEYLFSSNGYELILDIFILESNKYKQELKELFVRNSLTDDKKGVLFTSLPQYIWVIQGYSNDKTLAFDLLYDAVDTNCHEPYQLNIYSEKFAHFLKESGLSFDNLAAYINFLSN